MEEVRVETGVDDLIKLLKSKGKLAQKDVAEEMNVDEKYIQSWVDFLVEENIVGIEYKFTKPYLFLNDETSAAELETKFEEDVKEKGFIALKERYYAQAREKKIPDEKIDKLWKKHLTDALEKRKNYFLREVAKRKLENAQGLFEQYKAMLEGV